MNLYIIALFPVEIGHILGSETIFFIWPTQPTPLEGPAVNNSFIYGPILVGQKMADLIYES